MPNRNNQSAGMWDELPEEWLQQEEKQTGQTRAVDQKQDASGVGRMSQLPPEAGTEQEPNPGPNKRETSQTGKSSSAEKSQTKKPSFREKREQKKKLREFEEKSKKNRMQSSEHTKKAYQTEQAGNRRDFLALAVASAFVIIGIVIFVFLFTGTGQQKVYDMIEDGHYSTAYQAIAESHEQGKNVDTLVYTFVDSCVENNEYKRAVAALDFLSEEANAETDFFIHLITELRDRDKTNRVEDVLRFMDRRGGALSEAADRLRTEAQ